MSSTSIKNDAKLWLTNIDQPDNHSKELLKRLDNLAENEDGKHNIETELLTLSFDINVLSKFYNSLEMSALPEAKEASRMLRQVKLKINRSFDTKALFKPED